MKLNNNFTAYFEIDEGGDKKYDNIEIETECRGYGGWNDRVALYGDKLDEFLNACAEFKKKRDAREGELP